MINTFYANVYTAVQRRKMCHLALRSAMVNNNVNLKNGNNSSKYSKSVKEHQKLSPLSRTTVICNRVNGNEHYSEK